MGARVGQWLLGASAGVSAGGCAAGADSNATRRPVAAAGEGCCLGGRDT